MKRHRIRTVILSGIFVLLVGAFLFSGWKILDYFLESRKGKDTYNKLSELAVSTVTQPVVTHPYDDPSAPVPTAPTEEKAPVCVNFDALWEINRDIVAWVHVPDTVVDYPIAQSQDNDYYLYRLPDGTYNGAGTLFLDYRCSDDFTDFVSVIYGHNMKNDTMFGQLTSYKKQSYYEAHPVLYLLTPKGDYRVELFAGYTTSSDSQTYRLIYAQDEKAAFINRAKQVSDFQTDVEVTDLDRLLILSTCAYEYKNARYVVIGVLRPLP